MALKPVTRRYVFTSSAPVLFSSILDKPSKTWIGSIAIRAGRNNGDDVFWQDENGQSGGYIGPAEAVTMEFGEGQMLIGRFSLSGTANDTVYITIGVSSDHYDMATVL